MSLKKFVVVFSSILLLAFASTALANDNIVSTVVPLTGPTPTITSNGVPAGQIMLNYSWVTTSCTTGPFATFSLNMTDTSGSGTGPTYPASLFLADAGGGTPVQLSGSPSTVDVTMVGWTVDTTTTPVAPTVTVSIATCPSTFQNGTVMDGQMNVSSSDSHLKTITGVHVHITVVNAAACLNLYSFETDQDTGASLGSVVVNERHNNTSITGTSPGQASVDAMVVNTCSTSFTFDLGVGLDPEWQTNPHNNPGNATFTYTNNSTVQQIDQNTFNIASFGTGTAQGTNVCLTNVSLPPNQMFLVTVKSELNTGYNGGLTSSMLPTDSPADFDFSATIFQPNSSCGTAFPTPSIINANQVDTPNPVDPATATSDLTFTVHKP